MTPPAQDRDVLIAHLLDEVQAEQQAQGCVNLAALRARYPDLADELPSLLEMLKALSTAAEDWRFVSTPPQGDEQTAVNRAESIPERIGRYRILEKLGSGGMGAVYKAEDTQLQRIVAVKGPRWQGSTEERPVLLQRFLREARVAAGIRHPHVCPIYDVGEDHGVPFVVMECIEGQSLAQRLRGRQRFENQQEAVGIVRQTAEALEAVHAHGIVHRDMKPGNILIDATGKAVLTDFGLARPEADTEHLTTEGILPGTPAYMAPEQATGDVGGVGPAADIYGLGVVLYQMLTGRLPFEGAALKLIHQIGNESPPAPSRFRDDVDPGLEEILSKAMARQPADRFRSARAFADALAAWVPSARSPATRWRRKLPHVVAVVVIGLATLLLLRSHIFGGATWEPRGRLPSPRSGLMAAELNGLIYVVGGEDRGGFLDTVEAYDPAKGQFSPRASLPVRTQRKIDPATDKEVPWRLESWRAHGSLVVLQEELYLPGGWGRRIYNGDSNALPTDTLLIYRPTENAWSSGLDILLPPAEGIQVPNRRPETQFPGSAWSVAWVVDQTLYLLAGYPGSNEIGESPFLAYRHDTGWTRLSLPGHDHVMGAGGVIGGKLYVVGGHTVQNSEPTGCLHIYDPKDPRKGWITGQNLPTPRYGLACAVVADKLYAIGGHASGTGPPLATVEIYDPVTDTWSTGPKLLTQRRNHAAVAVGMTIYVLGGDDGQGPIDSIEALDVAKLQ
jgi:serine/threonine protein kinase